MGQIISFPCVHGYRGNCPHCRTCPHGVAGFCPACVAAQAAQPAGQAYAHLAPRTSYAGPAGQAYSHLAPRTSFAGPAGQAYAHLAPRTSYANPAGCGERPLQGPRAAGELTTDFNPKAAYIALAAIAVGIVGFEMFRRRQKDVSPLIPTA